MIYVCKLCGYEYDEDAEKIPFKDLDARWLCPVCGAPKDLFAPAGDGAHMAQPVGVTASARPLTASDAVMRSLSKCGLKWAFGMVGHSNLGLAQAIKDLCDAGKMNFVPIRHEGAAAFAASAYGKLTGRPAACLTIAGPGSTNLMTGLYDAKLDSAPLVALTGQIPTKEIGRYAFQEIDLMRVFADAALAQFFITAGSDFAKAAREAYEGAAVKKGVAQIMMPDDVQTHELSGYAYAAAAPRLRSHNPPPSPADIEKAARMLSEAKRPVLLLGEGARGAEDAALAFAETFNMPVMTTYRARGLVDESHQLCCGVCGRSGTPVSARFVDLCDCVLALGANFSNHTSIPKDKRAIQVDTNPQTLGRLHPVECPVFGGAAETLEALTPALKKLKAHFMDPREDISALKAAWKIEKQNRAAESGKGAITNALILGALSDKIPEDAIISIDVGNVAYDFGRYFEGRRQRILLSWYLGSIGCGLPAAMGAWCATQEEGEFKGRSVFAIVGDGGLGQYLAEWTSVVKSGMDIKCVVLNNSELGKISAEQKSAHMEVWQTGLINPNFAEFSRLCGGGGVRIADPEKLEVQLAEALSLKGPAIIEIITKGNI